MSNFQSGVVQLGNVSAEGKWKIGEELISIQFDSAALPDSASKDLDRYSLSTLPVAIRLPTMEKSIPGIVIGVDRENEFVTFYVSRNNSQ